MDKRHIENMRVKRSIQDALFSLMKKKRFSEITVTEIVSVAGVAKCSFYRNFASKEAVIESFLETIHEEAGENFRGEGGLKTFLTYENIRHDLEFYLMHSHYLVLAYQSGFGMRMQEQANRFAEDILGDMPSNSVERYQIYVMSGAMFNVIMQWFLSGAAESPAEMAHVILDCAKKILPDTP